MIFQQAIRGDDGLVDAGYLAMFWALIGWSVSTVVLLLTGAFAVWFKSGTGEAAAAIINNTGIALGAVSVGFGTVVGAVGLFRAGDKPRATTTTTVATKTVTEPATGGT